MLRHTRMLSEMSLITRMAWTVSSQPGAKLQETSTEGHTETRTRVELPRLRLEFDRASENGGRVLDINSREAHGRISVI